MEKPTHIYDVSGQHKHGRRAERNAVVAAHFENCTQTFIRLHATVAARLSPSRANAFEDYQARLTSWGDYTGANGLTLDHKLRHSTRLRETVTASLVQLQSVLDKGERHRR
jgi:hypothetical protein